MKGSPLEVSVLKDIDLSINEGEFVAIIGKTGSGKSTLIQHFNGLIAPSSGEVLVEGVNIWNKGVNLRQIRKKVGLVFQYPEHQMFEETVYKEIAFGARNMEIDASEIDFTVENAMNFVGLDYNELKDRSPFEISGGQKRRVAIASVLAMNPKVLILDEPTAGMDPKGRDEILSNISQLHDAGGYTIVLVSHSMEEVANYADRICVIYDGSVVMDDITRAVFSEVETLKGLGLGVPQVTEVMDNLWKNSNIGSRGIVTVDEAVEEIMKACVKRAGVAQ